MDDYYRPCDFSNICGYPHDLPETALERLPSFLGDNVISAKIHINRFNHFIAKWCNANNHEDVKMKLFVLSLEDEASEWFQDQDNKIFKDLKGIIEAFDYRWGDRKDSYALLSALHSSHKEENENIEDFNKRFNDIIRNLPLNIQPPDASLVIYYIQAFDEDMSYLIRDKEPNDLKDAQNKAIKIDKNMRAATESHVLEFSGGRPSEFDEGHIDMENQEIRGNSIDKLAQLIEHMEINHANQLAAMQASQIALQNKILAMEKDNPNNICQEQPSGIVETYNRFDNQITPYCRACDASHREDMCPIFIQIVLNGLAARDRCEHVNFVGHEHVFQNDNDDAFDSIDYSKKMVCMIGNVDKIEETCKYEVSPFDDVYCSDDFGELFHDVEVPVPVVEIVNNEPSIVLVNFLPVSNELESSLTGKESVNIRNFVEEIVEAGDENDLPHVKSIYEYLCANNPMFQRRLIAAHKYFQSKIALLWLVTKDKRQKHNVNQMLDWLHWLFHFT